MQVTKVSDSVHSVAQNNSYWYTPVIFIKFHAMNDSHLPWTLRGHSQPINCVLLSDDGKLVASGGNMDFDA